MNKVKGLVSQSRSTLCDPVDCSPPGSSVHGILQARVLEWGAIPFSRDLPSPGIEPGSPALQADYLLSEQPKKPHQYAYKCIYSRMLIQNTFQNTFYFWDADVHFMLSLGCALGSCSNISAEAGRVHHPNAFHLSVIWSGTSW